jgi:hypothetical protein
MPSSKDAGRATVPVPDNPSTDTRPPSDRYDDGSTLAAVHESLASIRKEMDRGLPIDPSIVDDLEAALARLEATNHKPPN